MKHLCSNKGSDGVQKNLENKMGENKNLTVTKDVIQRDVIHGRIPPCVCVLWPEKKMFARARFSAELPQKQKAREFVCVWLLAGLSWE